MKRFVSLIVLLALIMPVICAFTSVQADAARTKPHVNIGAPPRK